MTFWAMLGFAAVLIGALFLANNLQPRQSAAQLRLRTFWTAAVAIATTPNSSPQRMPHPSARFASIPLMRTYAHPRALARKVA